MDTDSHTALVQTGSPALAVAQLDALIAQKEREVAEAAQQAAPLSWQLQLGRELVALRELRLVGQGAILELSEVTLSAMQTASTIGLLAQVLIDGLQGKVEPAVIETVARIRTTGLEAVELVQASTAASLLDRTQAFKARSSNVRTRDLAYALATGRMPAKPERGRR